MKKIVVFAGNTFDEGADNLDTVCVEIRHFPDTITEQDMQGDADAIVSLFEEYLPRGTHQAIMDLMLHRENLVAVARKPND